MKFSARHAGQSDVGRQVWNWAPLGYPHREEVLSMRLGKEQAAGYVEDTSALEGTGADALQAEEVPTAQPEGTPLTTAAESSLTVS
jgi:hypothetical protein